MTKFIENEEGENFMNVETDVETETMHSKYEQLLDRYERNLEVYMSRLAEDCSMERMDRIRELVRRRFSFPLNYREVEEYAKTQINLKMNYSEFSSFLYAALNAVLMNVFNVLEKDEVRSILIANPEKGVDIAKKIIYYRSYESGIKIGYELFIERLGNDEKYGGENDGRSV